MNFKKTGAGVLALALCIVSAGAEFPQMPEEITVTAAETEKVPVPSAEEIISSLKDKDITESGKLDNNAEYSVYSSGVMTVTGNGTVNIPETGFSEETRSAVSVLIFINSDEQGITTIGKESFQDFSALETVYFTDTITEINSGAFKNCRKLSGTILPESLTVIGESAFESCISLSEIVFPEKLTMISEKAFRGCSSVNKVIIPDSVTCIQSEAFADCTGIKKIHLGKGIEYISIYNRSNCVFVNAFLNDINVTEITAAVSVSEWYLSDQPLFLSLFCYNQNTQTAPAVEKIELLDGNSVNHHMFAGLPYLKQVIIPETAESIGRHAFDGCSSLTEITIPDNVLTIEEAAFYGCSSLPEILLPEKLNSIAENAFYGCSSLTEIRIPDSVTLVQNFAFADCTGLRKISLGKGLNFISQYVRNNSVVANAFMNDVNVTELTLSEAPSNWYLDGFPLVKSLFCFNIPDEEKAKKIPKISKVNVTGGQTLSDLTFAELPELKEVYLCDSIEKIGRSAFADCPSLPEIKFPESLTTIDEKAFSNCTALDNLNFPDSLLYINKGAFEYCSSVSSLPLPENLDSIGEEAFLACTGIKELTVPDSVYLIGLRAFAECSELEKISLGKGTEKISSFDVNSSVTANAFYNDQKVTEISFGTAPSEWYMAGIPLVYSLFSYNPSSEKKPDIPKISKITVRDGTFIKANTFEDLTSLKEVIIPDSVITIESSAFKNCTSLSDIKLPYSLDIIYDNAFESCTSLSRIILPENLDSIRTNAFYGCSSLEEIVIPDSVTTVFEYAFAECTSVSKITVGKGIQKIGKYNESHSITQNAFCNDLNTEEIIFKTAPYEWYMSGNPLIKALFGSESENISDLKLRRAEILNGNFLTVSTFEGLSNLEEIVLPDSVKQFGNSVFENTDKLNTICFTGTEEQWLDIAYDPVSNPKLENIKVIYNYKPNEQTSLSGDVDGDGIIDLSDLTLLSVYLLKDCGLGETALVRADVNQDGQIDIADLATLKMIILNAE